MQNGDLTHEALASLGLDLTRYNQLVGEIYEGALDPKLMATALRSFLKLYDANFVTLILRVMDEPFLSPMMVAGDIELGEGGINHYAYYAKSTLFNNLPSDQVFTIDDLMSDAEWVSSSF